MTEQPPTLVLLLPLAPPDAPAVAAATVEVAAPPTCRQEGREGRGKGTVEDVGAVGETVLSPHDDVGVACGEESDDLRVGLVRVRVQRTACARAAPAVRVAALAAALAVPMRVGGCGTTSAASSRRPPAVGQPHALRLIMGAGEEGKHGTMASHLALLLGVPPPPPSLSPPILRRYQARPPALPAGAAPRRPHPLSPPILRRQAPHLHGEQARLLGVPRREDGVAQHARVEGGHAVGVAAVHVHARVGRARASCIRGGGRRADRGRCGSGSGPRRCGLQRSGGRAAVHT